ncbi:MAG: phage baseplate assembly protein V, partial [Bacteroidota bacterium]
CDRMGAWMYYDGEEMQFGSQGTTDPTSLTLGSDLHSFDLSLEMAPLNANYHAYQYLDNETYEGTGSQARVSDLDNNYGKVVYDSSEQFFNDSALSQARLGFASQSELDQFVGRRRNQQASRMVVLHGNSENIAVRIGSTVEILGSRSDNRSQGMENYGNFLVIRTSHKIYGDGNYQNMFEAIPEESAVPPVNPKVSIPQVQVQPAKVVENHDPQGLARLRVQFYWQSGNQLTPWIRTLSTAGGADGGFFVMPEIGDEVMIGFEYDDPDRPVVLGSLYHGNAKPSDSYQNGDNDIKAIKTKSGNEITIIDTAGSEEIRISTGDGNNSLSLTMAGGGTINFASGTEMTVSSTTINIQASDTLNLEANDINITAGNNLTVTAGADTTLDAGANVGMTAAANFTLDAGANLEESAGANLSLSAGANGDWATGANLNLDAGANFQANGGVNADINAGANAKLAGGAMADVEGGASAKVSGATVNIEGQAMTNVTGGIVKLN